MAEKIVGHLGKQWEFMKTMLKAYPADQLDQAHIINMLDLMREVDIDYRKVKSLTIEGAAHDVNDSPGIRYTGPFTNAIQASCSCVFSLCSTLVHGGCTYASQSDITNEDTLALVKKAKMVPNENLAFLCSHIIIEMEDGTVHERSFNVTPDHFCTDFATEKQAMRKLTGELPIPASQLEELIETIGALDAEADVSRLIARSTVG